MSDDMLPGQGGGEEFVSPREAAQRYEVAAQTLVSKLRVGALPGYKVRGPRGREWRVSTATLEGHGYVPRQAGPERQAPDVAALEAAVRELRSVVAYERRRADALDGMLGQASLEIGRLRAEVERLRRQTAAHAPEQEPAEVTIIDITVADPELRTP